jgi:guanyl-specific ribonuclease Sa
MKPPLPRTLSAVPQTLHARLEIAKAIRTLAGPDEDELLRQRRAEIAAIRRDLEALSRDLHKAFEAAATLAKAELRAALKKYSADQPRVPAGNPDGGQWTTGDGGSGSPSSSSGAASYEPEHPTRYAARETGTLTDETNIRETNSATAPPGNNASQVAQNTVTPRGFNIIPVPDPDPLDPKKLNGPILPDEQQKIANALNLILAGNVGTLFPHPYDNVPHKITGAVLPPASVLGYTTFDVPGLNTGQGPRGLNRLVIDFGSGAIYYTNTHYASFYVVDLNQP